MRVFIRRPSSQGLLSIWEHTSSSSRPWPAFQPDGSPTTLQQLLAALAPGLFPEGAAPAGAEPGQQQGGSSTSAGAGAGAGAADRPLASAAAEAGGDEGAAADGAAAGGSGAAAASPSARGQRQLSQQLSGLSLQQGARAKVLVGGVSPPLQAPLAWLHAHLHGPDYFLYVVVRADLAR